MKHEFSAMENCDCLLPTCVMSGTYQCCVDLSTPGWCPCLPCNSPSGPVLVDSMRGAFLAYTHGRRGQSSVLSEWRRGPTDVREWKGWGRGVVYYTCLWVSLVISLARWHASLDSQFCEFFSPMTSMPWSKYSVAIERSWRGQRSPLT